MGGAAKPILGYPSKTAAVIALVREGKKPAEIAGMIGSPVQSVHNTIATARREGRLTPASPDATPGVWTPEKLSKARRLFGKTMIMIADALAVPAGELLAYGLNGVLPPMGERQRIGQLLSDLAAGDGPVPQMPALPAPDAPSRDDDEAELARLAEGGEPDEAEDLPFVDIVAEPQMAPERPSSLVDEIVSKMRGLETVPAPPAIVPSGVAPEAFPMAAAVRSLVRLHNEAGEYLHENERQMTRLAKFTWRGTPDEARRLKRKKPQLRRLTEETC